MAVVEAGQAEIGAEAEASAVFTRYLDHPAVARYLGGLLVVGEAAGLTPNTGLTVRGPATRALEASVVGAGMRAYRRAPRFLDRPRLYHDYGRLAADLLLDVHHHDLPPAAGCCQRRSARSATPPCACATSSATPWPERGRSR